MKSQTKKNYFSPKDIKINGDNKLKLSKYIHQKDIQEAHRRYKINFKIYINFIKAKAYIYIQT